MYPSQQYHQPPQGAQAGFAPPPQHPNPSYPQDIEVIHKACKGFGCDEKAVITILGTRDAATIDAIRSNYKQKVGKDLISTLIKETSGNLETSLVATALGPDESEAFWANKAISGLGTNETMLTEAIMGKNNLQMNAIKSAYQRRYKTSLERDVKGDLSGNTENLFVMALDAQREDDWVQPRHETVIRNVQLLRSATKGLGTDEVQVFLVFTRSNDAHIRAIAQEYERLHKKSLQKLIKEEFSGHQRQALTYIVDGALNKVARDARLLEDAMAGIGTKNDLLISRLVRIHWDPQHLAAVKREYFNIYHRDLGARIKGETSGNYERMLLTLLGP